MTDLEREITMTLRREAVAGPRFAGLARAPSTRRTEVRRLRPWWGFVAIGSAVAAIVAGGFVLGALHDGEGSSRDPGLAGPPTAADTAVIDGPQVGRGRLVVSVPQSWARGASRCGVATEDTVLFVTLGAVRTCFLPPAEHSTVAIDAAPSPADLDGFEPTEVSGGQVYVHETVEDGFTVIVLSSPEQDAVLTIRSRDPVLAAAIAGSAQLLPDTMTTVPDLTTGATGGEPGVSGVPGPDELRLRLARAGIHGVIAFEAGASAQNWSRVATDVPAGTVVDVGSTVKVTYSGSSMNKESSRPSLPEVTP